jgi:hypothetical protein
MIARRSFIGCVMAVLTAPLALFAAKPVTIRGVPVKWIPRWGKRVQKPKPLLDWFRTPDGFFDSKACLAELRRGAAEWFDHVGCSEDGLDWMVVYRACAYRDTDYPLGMWVSLDRFVRGQDRFLSTKVHIDAREEFSDIPAIHSEILRRALFIDAEACPRPKMDSGGLYQKDEA